MPPEDIDPHAARIAMTVSCRDCEGVPKVADAGRIVEENGERVQIMHNGLRVAALGYHGAWMSEIITRLRGHHEPQEEAVFDAVMRLLPRQASMLELGGFWSYYSLWFLRGAPESRRAIVLEPDPAHIAVGARNARLNGATSIEFIQGFIAPTPTPEQMFPSETSGQIMVRGYSVPEILASRGIARLDVLHCDTQGAELGVVASCEALLRNHQIQFVFFSTHAHQISGDPLTHQRCLAMLRDFGGHILAEHDVHESFSGDGLIAAYFGDDPLTWPGLTLSVNRYSTGIFPNPLYDLADARQTIQAQAAAIAALERERNELSAALDAERRENRAVPVAAPIPAPERPRRSAFDKVIGRLTRRP